MEYGRIAYTDKSISRLVFGTALPSMQKGERSDTVLNAAWETGINAFDTARGYKRSESVLGEWLERRCLRDDAVLIVKGGLDGLFGSKRVNEKCIRADLEKSLENLRTDKADIYMLHRDDMRVPAGTVAEILNALHAEGKIDAFGGSNWTAKRVEEVNEYAYAHNLQPFSLTGPNYSLAEQVVPRWGGGIVGIGGKSGEKDREFYRKNEIAVFSYAALAGGFMSGKICSGGMEYSGRALDMRTVRGYLNEENVERLRRAEVLAAKKRLSVAQIALAFIFSRGLNVFATVSNIKVTHIISNTLAFDVRLTKEEGDWLDLASEKL